MNTATYAAAIAAAIIAQEHFSGKVMDSPYYVAGRPFWWTVNAHHQIEVTEADPLVQLVKEYHDA